MPKLTVASDFVGEPGERSSHLVRRIAELRQREIGPDRCVAARDVESDADDRHLLAIGRDAADGHDVPNVSVGHQRRVGRA